MRFRHELVSVRLEGRGSGTTEIVEFDVKVTMPVIDAKLEGLMADDITGTLAVEQPVGTAWLGGDR